MNIAQNGIKRSHRQTHDAVIVALDALDEQCAVALDAVGAGLVERLSGGEVGGKLVLRKIAEGDARAGVQRVRPAVRREHGKSGQHLVGASAQTAEHGSGLVRVLRLAEAQSVDRDHGIRADAHGVRVLRLHSLGLEAGKTGDFLTERRIPQGFVRIGRADRKVFGDKAQKLPAPRRSGR